MIINSYWLEMHKAYGFQRQIEIYTDRKRRSNRIVSIVLLCTTLICSIASLFSQQEWGHWVTVGLAALVTIASFIKEFKPQISQSEGELRDLDKIHDFYKDYLQKLEFHYIQRFDEKLKVDDNTMNKFFNEIKNTEGDRITTLNRLCRKMRDDERKRIKDDTEQYFRIKYNSNNHEPKPK